MTEIDEANSKLKNLPRYLGWVVLVALIDSVGLAIAVGLVAVGLALELIEVFTESNNGLAVMVYTVVVVGLATLITCGVVAFGLLSVTPRSRRRAIIELGASLPAWLLLIITFAPPSHSPGEFNVSMGVIGAMIIALIGILPSLWSLIYLHRPRVKEMFDC